MVHDDEEVRDEVHDGSAVVDDDDDESVEGITAVGVFLEELEQE